MPKASLTLENGTVVTIEGTASEVHELLSFYGSAASRPAHGQVHKSPAAPVHRDPRSAADDAADAEVDLMTIVNHVKACDEAENIESRILDQTDQLPRVLLPMYMVYEHMSNAHGLTSGQISKVTTQLGVPVKQPNVSKILAGAAAKYIIGDAVRKNGQAVRYKLSRRGHAYLKEIISGRKENRPEVVIPRL
ncbi:MAG: hypothetical protein DMG59_14215 [Acidobacteria bacterium]|nr:MAG: hypothetical protein DMG59_14215 [Acidobacteriota bacterium]